MTTTQLQRVLTILHGQRTDRYELVTLPALLAECDDMTLGQFHDLLRDARDAKLIRLIPYTRALASIPDARNALYLDGEVMYYATPCQPM